MYSDLQATVAGCSLAILVGKFAHSRMLHVNPPHQHSIRRQDMPASQGGSKRGEIHLPHSLTRMRAHQTTKMGPQREPTLAEWHQWAIIRPKCYEHFLVPPIELGTRFSWASPPNFSLVTTNERNLKKFFHWRAGGPAALLFKHTYIIYKYI